MKESDARTLDYYDDNAVTYSARLPSDKDLDALDLFMSELPDGSNLCDLGCGNGWASAKLIESGFVVKSIDGSAGLIAEAKRLHGVTVKHAKFEDFYSQSEFDGLWACWSLHHVPRAVFPILLKRVSTAIVPGGLLFFSLKGGSDEGRDECNRLYSYFDWEELAAIVADTVDGRIISHKSWNADSSDVGQSLRHQVFIRMAD